MTMTPRLEIYPARIAHNAATIKALCAAHGATMAGVGKVMCAHPAVMDALVTGGADWVADSRVENLAPSARFGLPRLLLRLPTPSQAHDVVTHAEVSLVSSVHTMQALGDAARAAGRTHQVIVMIDLGDLREGVWPDTAVEVARAGAAIAGLDLIGVGANLACYGGVVPTVDNMMQLVNTRDLLREATGLELGVISGGNSANLPLLASGLTPPEINHFRMGESIILGRNVLDRSAWAGTRQDTLRLVTEIIEVERKPSLPIGLTAQNAFGEEVVCEDRGVRRRAICNIGRQDANLDGLEPVDPRITIIGGSSDHLIIDVEDAPELKVGDEVAMWPSYGATLALSTSPYVHKVVLDD